MQRDRNIISLFERQPIAAGIGAANMLERVPKELRELPRWLVWKYVQIEGRDKPTKVPLQVSNGYGASVTDPNHWCYAHMAIDCLARNASAIHGVGFVLGGEYAGVDLDDVLDPLGNVLQPATQNIVDALDSYTERSVGGRGLHVIVKGTVPTGTRYNNVEIYGDGRYFTMSGHVWGPDRPIIHNQVVLDHLVSDINKMREHKPRPAIDWAAQPIADDLTVYNKCLSLANGDKFFKLWNGDFADLYPSTRDPTVGDQSRADFALCDMLAYHTNSATQILRMFYTSALGQRDKARQRQSYVSNMVARAFDRKDMETPIHTMANPFSAPTAKEQQEAQVPAYTGDAVAYDPFEFPNGLVGEIAAWVHSQSIYPIKAASLAAAFTYMAGICGRQYQLSNVGLNLYIMLLAKTGTGKEAMTQGISKLMAAVSQPPVPGELRTTDGFPASKAFRGPSQFTGRGVINAFENSGTGSLFFIANEFAQTMKEMASPNGNQGMKQLKHNLLDLYMKSTEGASFQGIMTADKKTDVKEILSPALTILCESTPGRLYPSLDLEMVNDGLLPRFTIIDTDEFTLHINNDHALARPSSELVTRVTQLVTYVLDMKARGNDKREQITWSPEAYKSQEDFRYYCRVKVAQGKPAAELWNRAHLNALRMSGLLAIGCTKQNVVVTKEQFDFAAHIVLHSVTRLEAKFDNGEIGIMISGMDDNSLLADIRKNILRFQNMSIDQVKTSSTYKKFINGKLYNVIPHSYLVYSCRGAVWSADKRPAGIALDAMIKTMKSTGELTNTQLVGTDGQPVVTGGIYYKADLH